MKKLLLTAILVSVFCNAAGAQETCDGDAAFRVTILGSGTPVPLVDRFGAATLVEVNGQNLLFDAGRGVAQRIWQVGLPLREIDTVFLTHLHHDHTIGLPDLLITGWLPPAFGQRAEPIPLMGPTKTSDLARGIEAAWASDIAVRTADELLDPNAARFDVTELHEGVVYEKDGVKVTAFPVDHGELIENTFGFVIEHNGRRVVLSGDTKYDERVATMAEGADLLVHAVAAASNAVMASGDPRIARIFAHMASPDDVGRIFAAAKPKVAALYHITQMPPNPPTPEEIVATIAEQYSSKVVAAVDLTCFTIGETVTVGTRSSTAH